MLFVIATGEKRTNERVRCNAIGFCYPVSNGLIYVVWRIAIVCCLFGFKLVEEILVFFVFAVR